MQPKGLLFSKNDIGVDSLHNSEAINSILNSNTSQTFLAKALISVEGSKLVILRIPSTLFNN